MKSFGDNNEKNKIRWLRYILLGGFFIKFLINFIKKDKREIIEKNLKEFYCKEKKEAAELINGKESINKYVKNSCVIFSYYFIPNDCNNYKPRILRSKSLATIAILLFLVKSLIVSYLFFIYPNVGKMAQLITQEIFTLINKERESNYISALKLSEKLNKPAQAKASDMITNNYFAHKSPNGKMPWDWIDRKDYPYIFAGENLAMNFTTAISAHKALMLSESHKKNVLNAKYTDIGLAVVNGQIDNKNTNVLVQLFGSSNNTAKTVPVKEKIINSQEKKITKPVIPVKEKEPINVLSAENKQTDIIPDNTKPIAEANTVQNNPANSEQKNNEIISNKELNDNLSLTVKEINLKSYEKYSVASRVVFYSKYIFSGALIFMIMLFLVNIFVKINIQHKTVIVQTFLLILFIAGLLSVKIHFLEGISQNIIIF